jgi:hypothetical protein
VLLGRKLMNSLLTDKANNAMQPTANAASD